MVAGATKILEAQHRSGDGFDGPMVLLDPVIQVLFFNPPKQSSPRGIGKGHRGCI
jgi:hypothetical protein